MIWFAAVTTPASAVSVASSGCLPLMLVLSVDNVVPPSISAFRFVTIVVDSTTNGAVPVVAVEVNCGAVAVPVKVLLPAMVWLVVRSTKF